MSIGNSPKPGHLCKLIVLDEASVLVLKSVIFAVAQISLNNFFGADSMQTKRRSALET